MCGFDVVFVIFVPTFINIITTCSQFMSGRSIALHFFVIQYRFYAPTELHIFHGSPPCRLGTSALSTISSELYCIHSIYTLSSPQVGLIYVLRKLHWPDPLQQVNEVVQNRALPPTQSQTFSSPFLDFLVP